MYKGANVILFVKVTRTDIAGLSAYLLLCTDRAGYGIGDIIVCVCVCCGMCTSVCSPRRLKVKGVSMCDTLMYITDRTRFVYYNDAGNIYSLIP